MRSGRKPDLSLSISPGTLRELRDDFGFKNGIAGAHTARTMMLADLNTVLGAAPGEAKRKGLHLADR